MRDFNNSLFSEILKQVVSKKEFVIHSEILSKDLISLKYFLTRNYYYTVIVDDYPFEIISKSGLLEALYYQVRLITIHGLNWDAIQEGFETLLNENLTDFEGICLLFKNGNHLANTLPNEFKVLTEIIQEINNEDNRKNIVMILN